MHNIYAVLDNCDEEFATVARKPTCKPAPKKRVAAVPQGEVDQIVLTLRFVAAKFKSEKIMKPFYEMDVYVQNDKYANYLGKAVQKAYGGDYGYVVVYSVDLVDSETCFARFELTSI